MLSFNEYNNQGINPPLKLGDYTRFITQGRKLDAREKIQLGKLLGKVEIPGVTAYCQKALGFLSTRMADYFAEQRANAYINTIKATQDVLLRSTFGIAEAPSKESVGLYAEKQAFMSSCLEGAKKQVIISQSKRFPLFKSGVEKLRENYEKWDLMPAGKERNELKALIKQQHENLTKLSSLLEELSQGKGGDDEGIAADALARTNALKLLDTHQLKDDLAPFFEGKARLDQMSTEILRTEMAKVQEEIVQQSPKLTTEQYKTQREESPITKIALEKQAKVFKVERQTKRWAVTQQELTAQGKSANIVVKIQDKYKPNKTIGFYKEGKEREKAAGTIEKFFWDMAVIMKMENMFAATKETKMKTKQGVHEGGVQVAQAGKTLSDRLDQKNLSITKEQVIQGTLPTIVFGMFDAHLNNIIVDDEGCHFFDNTRSMPHSNGYINWGDELISSYRSGLLNLPESFEPLQPEELSKIKDQLAACQKEFEHLKAFMTSEQSKKQFAKLPTGWMNPTLALNAMKERLDRMQKALDDNKVHCLRDLAFAATPEIKFMAILTLAIQAQGKPILTLRDKKMIQEKEQLILTLVGSYSLEKLTGACVKAKLDPQKLKDLCEDPNLSFEALMCKVSVYANEVDKTKTREELIASRNKILNDARKQAKLDLKDISRDHCETYLSLPQTISMLESQMKEDLTKRGIPILNSTQSQEIESKKQSLQPSESFAVYEMSRKEYVLYSKDIATSPISKKKIDFLSSPGEVTFV